MRQDITPAERRARVICNLLGHDPALSTDKLRQLSAPDLSRPYTQRRRMMRRLSAPDEFEKAVELAISTGWLEQGQGETARSNRGRPR